jgi:tetratricopeptide (TPR) repeat protein
MEAIPATAAQSGTQPPVLTDRLVEVALSYQRMLTENPLDPRALIGISLVALASSQSEAAVEMARAAVDAAPEMVVAWVALGQALKAAHRSTEAEHAYQTAIGMDGMNSLARMGLGELMIATGRTAAAIREFELALQHQPSLVPAQMGMGHALACLGRNSEALEHYENVLALRPKLPDAEFAAGFVLARLGRLKEAETRYRRALAQRRDFAAAWLNLGSLLRDQGREVYAEAAIRRAVELRPELIPGWLTLAQLERERGHIPEAEEHLQKALALNSDQVETEIAWCQHCASQKDMPQAWAWLNRALAHDSFPNEALNMQGILLHTEGRFAEAVEAFQQAEAAGHHAAASNRGNSLLDLGLVNEAIAAHQHAVELDPHSPGALYNLSLTRLRLGDWQQGWPGYEARWNFREIHRSPRIFPQPRWKGEPLEGRRILLHAEQGLGDTIQFCRYLPLVTSRGGTAVLQVQPAVERLMASHPTVRAGLAQTALLGTEPPQFDLECPLMSLPAVFGTTVDTVPWLGAYLGADPQLAAQKRKHFPSIRPGARVGLAWAGNPRYKADSRRSTQLDNLLPLLRTPSINWISLQKGEPAEQLTGLPGDIFIWDGSSADADLAETSALVATLDLVITTDTCIAHLAGAMGKPVWILLSHLSDWRWMQQIETTPWYPTARLLRQSKPGDWMSLVERASTELRNFSQPFQAWVLPLDNHSAPAPASASASIQRRAGL